MGKIILITFCLIFLGNAQEKTPIVDNAYGWYIRVDEETLNYFKKWYGETQAKHKVEVYIELPDTVLEMTFDELMKRLKNGRK